MKIPNSLLKLMLAGAGSAALATTALAMSTPGETQSPVSTEEKPTPTSKPTSKPTATPTPKPTPRPLTPDHCPMCGMG